MVGAFILIIIGIIFLGINFGVINSNVWSTIWQYWPVILILIGISILCKSVMPKVAANVITIIAIILAFGGIVLFSNLNQANNTGLTNNDSQTLVIDEPISSSTTKLVAEVSLGAQKLTLEDLNSGLINGRIEGVGGSTPTYTLKEVDGTAQLDVNQKTGFTIWPTKKNTGSSRLALSNQVPLELALNVGAVNITGDLSRLKLEKFVLKSGAMTADIKLGDLVAKNDIKIDTGASKLDIRVPKSVGLKVIKSVGASTVNFKDMETNQNGDTITTKDFDKAAKTITVDLNCGASTINFIGY